MANKSRPKKAKAPYRKYVGGIGYVTTAYGKFQTSDDEYEDEGNKYYHSDQEETYIDGTEDRPSSNSSDSEKGLDPKFLYVCKEWYIMYLPILYSSPYLNSKNFNKFMVTMDINKKTPALGDKSIKLNELVLKLDLSTIVQSGRNSFVSKLLRRCNKSLTEFIAPQTSFGYAPLISLKSCHNLQRLDLSLVSETVDLDKLFQAIIGFEHLKELFFPRCSINCDLILLSQNNGNIWPRNVKYLKLSGSVTNDFIMNCDFPRSLQKLELAYCPLLNELSIYKILSQIGDNLETLIFQYPMPSLQANSLDFMFKYTGSRLKTVQIVVDYCSKWLFQDEDTIIPCLETIYLQCSGSLGQAFKIHPDDLTVAIMENRIPCLKNLYVSCKLGWDMNSDDVEDLLNVLEDQGGHMYITY
ncbi:Pfu1p SCDLUD_004637 [Saccharomycodes ludwigii]|uniref:Pfu1p n=1 Tax=Saccharomycodes ludwigii TaxID=36035 RepID=UPI001E844708|nr:hypothetical protein SCDLUD_004637 [Saccharomycodes ludwigii]KAH3899206.1 hypothetical protein SCDLUD_004637 [Saccharomycodes ludwigii]